MSTALNSEGKFDIFSFFLGGLYGKAAGGNFAQLYQLVAKCKTRRSTTIPAVYVALIN